MAVEHHRLGLARRRYGAHVQARVVGSTVPGYPSAPQSAGAPGMDHRPGLGMGNPLAGAGLCSAVVPSTEAATLTRTQGVLRTMRLKTHVQLP